MLLKATILNQLTEEAKKSPRLRMNYNLHKTYNDAVQRMFNAIEPGAIIPVARHPYSNETLILLRGSLKIVIYNSKKEIIEEAILDITKGNIGYHIPKGTWHTVQSLESGTVLFETREGPYKPVGTEDILL